MMRTRLSSFVLLMFITTVQSRYTLTVLLKRFDAGQGFLFSGEHCDPMWFSNQNCNLRLKICVEVLSDPNNQEDDGYCNQIPFGPGAGQFIDLGNVTDNQNRILFKGNGAQYGGWSNPMRIVAPNSEYGGFRIKVQAYNYYGTSLQIVDMYRFEADKNGGRPIDFDYFSHPRPMAPEPTLLGLSWAVEGDIAGQQNGPTTPTTPAPITVAMPFDCSGAEAIAGKNRIRLPNGRELDVFCNKAQATGGYMIIQNRDNANDFNFNRSYESYRSDFGYWNGPFWFGLDNMNSLTSNFPSVRYDLLIEGCCAGPSNAQFSDLYVNFTVGPGRDFYPINAVAVGTSIGMGLDQSQGGVKDLGSNFSINNGQDYYGTFKPPGACQISTGGGGWWFGACRNHPNANFIDRIMVDPATCKVRSNSASSITTDFQNGFGVEYRRSTTTIPFGSPAALTIDGIAYTKIRMSVRRSDIAVGSYTQLTC